MAILAADKDKEIKTLFLKYMAWNMLPLLYNDALKKLCKMGFSPAKATKLLKSMQENGEIEIVSNLHYFGNKRCRLLPGIHLRYLWLMRNESFEEFEKNNLSPDILSCKREHCVMRCYNGLRRRNWIMI